MGFLDKLKKVFSGGTGGGAPLASKGRLLDVAVRCDRCGEVIHGQINLSNDLSVQYDGDDSFYFCRKGLVGGRETRCFQEVIIEYTFDARRNVIDRHVEGGQFADSERPVDNGA
jgi:hypothetical protein